MRLLHRINAGLLFTLMVTVSNAVKPDELASQLLECSKQTDTQQRLLCYDTLAKAQQSAGVIDYITPSDAFLNSRLTVVPEKSDYTLTIRDFVELAASAIMENKKKVTVQGWTREDNYYVLHITMRKAQQLKFLPLETADKKIPMSLLISPVIDGKSVDPELFILTIASMVPDDGEVKDQ